MEHSKHHDLLRLDFVEDRVGKAPHDCTADITEYLRVQLWCGADPVENLLHLRNEIHAETRASLLIPIECLVELSPGLLAVGLQAGSSTCSGQGLCFDFFPGYHILGRCSMGC